MMRNLKTNDRHDGHIGKVKEESAVTDVMTIGDPTTNFSGMPER